MSRISIHPYLTLFLGTKSFIEYGGILSEHQQQTLQTYIDFATYEYRFDKTLSSATEALQVLMAKL
jgi:hypothetical protein